MLKTHSSNGSNESSENSRYKYCGEEGWLENSDKLLFDEAHLKRLSEEKALLDVVLLRWINVHVLDPTVAAVSPAMLLESLLGNQFRR